MSTEAPTTETPKEAVQEQLSTRANIKRALMLEAVDNIGDSMEWELDTVKDEQDFYRTALGLGDDDTDGDEMSRKNLVAGDQTIHQYFGKPEEQKQQQPTAPTQPPVATQPKPAPPPDPKPIESPPGKGWGNLLPLLTVLTGVALALGGAGAAYWATRPTPEPPPAIDTDTIPDVAFPP